MKTIEQRRKEFLDETVEFYSEDVSRRAINEIGKCRYRMNNGNKCAIGRWIPDEKYKLSLEGTSCNSEMLKILPDEIQELGCKFLWMVQQLHDRPQHWNKEGLTEEGKKYIKEIKKYE